MRKLLLGLLALAIPIAAYAQQGVNPGGTAVGGFAINRSTVNNSVTLTTSGVFTQILSSNVASNVIRQALTVQNNNLALNCYVFLGGVTTASQSAATSNSVLLLPGGSYTRYWPFVPSDPIQAACLGTNGTIYVEVQ